MYDPETSALIRSAPDLPGLDREGLPDKFSRFFAEIVSARVALREGAADREKLTETIQFARRLAQTNEALVAIDPERANRAAAGFVAATAYQLLHQTVALRDATKPIAYVRPDAISPDISAMILFLAAEASADASEVAASIRLPDDDPLQRELIQHLILLAKGKLGEILKLERPSRIELITSEGAKHASDELYFMILRGVRLLVDHLTAQDRFLPIDPLSYFESVKNLSAPKGEELIGDFAQHKILIFGGPFHLASLLIAAGSALLGSAVVNLPPPSGVHQRLWQKAMGNIAKTHPYMWSNHKSAVNQGYLEVGVSSVVAFPTGAGKTRTAHLKIYATLLSNRKVVFLAPTHALIDQITRDLRTVFRHTTVRGEISDETSVEEYHNTLPEIIVMTPEACLLATHTQPEIFENVGLLIFDEFHLIQPRTDGNRRAIDAMLCILSFNRIVPEADFLLLSAMVKNAKELSLWLSELTSRPALALDNTWKPTRQLRGCIVYESEEFKKLQNILKDARKLKKKGDVPSEIKKNLVAKPEGFFSIKQTWASQRRKDYALVSIVDEYLPLSVNKHWKLTPNSGVLASSIAASAAKAGLRTLIFSRSIPNAASISNRISGLIDDCEVVLSDEEKRLYDIAVDEIGEANQLYLVVSDQKITTRAGVHHGLLISEERQLVESLYKRTGALAVLAATPTLGQGMNLPADLVIIAEDSQFDVKTGKRDILSPEDLLNAAGRAGRAGESATGVVLVIPGKVVSFDRNMNQIGNRWAKLRDIFGQSDQCLVLDDPLTNVMDKIQKFGSDVGDIERYVVARLAEGQEEGADIKLGLSKSFAAFRMRQAGHEDWVTSRTEAALSLINSGMEETAVASLPLRNVASMLGIPEDILYHLKDAMRNEQFDQIRTVHQLHDWMFDWLKENPKFLMRLIKPDILEYIFGAEYKDQKNIKDQANYVIPIIRSALLKWMEGRSLSCIQTEISQKTRDKKKNTSARKFVIRLIPEISHIFSIPLHLSRVDVSSDDSQTLGQRPALAYAGVCAKRGYATAEMAAYAKRVRFKKFARRELHRQFASVLPYISQAVDGETIADVEKRVETAYELASQGRNSLREL